MLKFKALSFILLFPTLIFPSDDYSEVLSQVGKVTVAVGGTLAVVNSYKWCRVFYIDKKLHSGNRTWNLSEDKIPSLGRVEKNSLQIIFSDAALYDPSYKYNGTFLGDFVARTYADLRVLEDWRLFLKGEGFSKHFTAFVNHSVYHFLLGYIDGVCEEVVRYEDRLRKLMNLICGMPEYKRQMTILSAERNKFDGRL